MSESTTKTSSSKNFAFNFGNTKKCCLVPEDVVELAEEPMDPAVEEYELLEEVMLLVLGVAEKNEVEVHQQLEEVQSTV